MPDLKISQLAAGTTPLAGTELVPIVQSGVTSRTTVQAIMSSTVPSGTANGVLYLNGSKVATSGSALVFDGSNLGIGTSSPATKLHVNTGAAGYGITVAALSQTSRTYQFGVDSNSNFAIYDSTAAAQRVVLDQSGNLGLGVTPSAWNTTFYTALQVGAGASLFGSKTNAAVAWMGANAFFNSSNSNTYIATAAATQYRQLNGEHAWYTAPSGTAGTAISFTQAMTLFASGGLSVGNTIDPGVSGKVSAAALALTNGNLITNLSPQGTAETRLESYTGGATGFLTFYAGNNERARIDASGNLLITSTGGLGYGTGSGGAVTQITSRTTGVTLNKTNGAITLVSAAGTATWQSFTVTNSTVTATDTVIVNQKSGTDLYQIFVTAVAAGSFRISFATTGGTTTEQPVFNFAVIKAVTA